jgi:hypothetical protein
MAAMVLGSVGSSLLGPLGGFIGSAIGGYVDKLIFGSSTKPPRIEDTAVTRAEPGVPIPLVYGADRVAGIVIASSDLIETANKQSIGGKGGAPVVSYTYHVDIDYMLSEGPVLGIGRIWAEGNIVRGTRYEMETSTSEHPQNIGGIPYPSYYRDHLYEPTLIPWSIIREYTDTDDGNFYKANGNMSAMIRITEGEANDLLTNTKQVVYWRDTATGYYIPLHESHAYTGRLVEGPPLGEFDRRLIQIPGRFISWTETIEVFVDLDSDGPGTYSFNQLINITASFGLTNGRAFFQVEFYSEGDNILLDDNTVGVSLQTDSPDFRWEDDEPVVALAFTGTIPAEARYVRFRCQYLLNFPVFADMVVETGSLEISKGYLEGDDPDVRDWPDYWNLYDAINDFSERAVLTYIGPDNITVYPGHDTQIPDPTMEATLDEDVPAYIGRAHVVFDRLELGPYGNRIPSFSFEVVQYDDARVADALSDMMRRAGVDDEYFDISALPDMGQASHILGYTVGDKTDYRAAMELLLETFRVDVAEIGNSLVFRPRDRGTDLTIDYSDLGGKEAEYDDDQQALVRIAMRDEVSMPRNLSLRFKDVERNYQGNTAIYMRQMSDAVGDALVEYAAVIPAENAKTLVRDKMRDIWMERFVVSFELPPKYINVAPTDILFIDGTELGKDNLTVRVTRRNRGANGLIEIEGTLHDITLYVPAEGEDDRTLMDNTGWRGTPPVPGFLPRTDLYLMDVPPLVEQHGNFGFYAAFGSPQPNWRGAEAYRSLDGGAASQPLFSRNQRAIAGVVHRATLVNGLAEVVDTASRVYIIVNDFDELSSVTPDQLLAGRNMAIIGNEVVQFMTAARLSANEYMLSNFLRGRRGTDLPSILAGHTLGERFVLLESPSLVNVSDTLSYRGVPLEYRGVTYTQLPSAATPQQFTNTGARVRPFSPVMITGTRDMSDNLTISWARRDRRYTALLDGSDLPNAETILRFELDIMDGPDVVRTITVENATQASYTAAQQTSDGLTPGAPVTVNVYQISSIVGRGNAGAAVV